MFLGICRKLFGRLHPHFFNRSLVFITVKQSPLDEQLYQRLDQYQAVERTCEKPSFNREGLASIAVRLEWPYLGTRPRSQAIDRPLA
jgi:hypothetical protein